MPPRGKRAPSWTTAELLDLISLWGEEAVQSQLRSSRRNYDTFGQLSKSMLIRGHDRDAVQCRVKVKELRSAYHKAREGNRRSGAAPTTCRFYREMDAILGGDPTANPRTTMDTSDQAGVQEQQEEEETASEATGMGEDTPDSVEACSQELFSSQEEGSNSFQAAAGEGESQTIPGLGFLLFCGKSAFGDDYDYGFDDLSFYDLEDLYSGSGSDSNVDCGPNAVPYNISHCICEDGFRSISGKEPFLGTSESRCDEIPLHCRSGFTRENDYVKMCLNGSLQINLDNRKNSSFCSLVNSTLSLLTPACENVSLTTSLEETAASFEHVLADSSLWSLESKEEVASAATLLLQSLGSAAVTAALASPENQTQTATTKLMAIQTKLTDENCSLQSEVLGFRAHEDRMDIHCTVVTDADMEGSAAVAFISYVGLESLLGGRFLQDENQGSEAKPEQVRVNSRVVSASTSTWKKKPSSPINLTFRHLEDKTLLDRAICVHWNSADQDGVWSPQGCQHLHSNVTHTRCSCRYLASFAVLMEPGVVEVDFALFVISQTGLIISLICLIVAIVTFLFCHPIRNTSSTFLHLQLSICLFLADLLFIVGIDKTYNKLMCSITAGLLHYLFLACFAWMFLEAVNLYLIVRNLKVKNYAGTGRCTRKCMYVFGYGLPAVIVITSATSAPSSYGTPYHCWLNPDNGFRWNFLGPVCAVVVINLVFFCLTLKLLREHLSSLNAELSTVRNTRSLTFKALAHLLVLGLTWWLGTFQFGSLATVMGYLFTITNSLLGTFIFVVHCLLNRKVREEYWKLFTRLRQSKEEPSSSNITMSALPSSTAADPQQNAVLSHLKKAARD